jgi:hypothetical protein
VKHATILPSTLPSITVNADLHECRADAIEIDTTSAKTRSLARRHPPQQAYPFRADWLANIIYHASHKAETSSSFRLAAPSSFTGSLLQQVLPSEAMAPPATGAAFPLTRLAGASQHLQAEVPSRHLNSEHKEYTIVVPEEFALQSGILLRSQQIVIDRNAVRDVLSAQRVYFVGCAPGFFCVVINIPPTERSELAAGLYGHPVTLVLYNSRVVSGVFFQSASTAFCIRDDSRNIDLGCLLGVYNTLLDSHVKKVCVHDIHVSSTNMKLTILGWQHTPRSTPTTAIRC